jgi:hypothetical protein
MINFNETLHQYHAIGNHSFSVVNNADMAAAQTSEVEEALV